MQSKQVVLVVEDEPSLIKALVRKLESYGLGVVTATDGKQGLAQALKTKPDLILLDLYLPKLDGIKLLQQLRQDSWGENCKVICLTNRQLDDEITNYLEECKPMYYLIKADNSLEDIMSMTQKALAS